MWDSRRAVLMTAAVLVIATTLVIARPALSWLIVVASAAALASAATRRSRWSIASGAIAYILLLEWVYAGLIATGVRFVYVDHEWYELLIVVALAWLPSFALPRHIELMSQTVTWVLYTLVYVPAALVGFHTFGLDPELHVTLLMGIALLLGGLRIPRSAWFRYGLSPAHHGVVLGLLGIAGAVFVIAMFGLSLELPHPQAVTATRLAYKESREAGSMTAYLVPWLGRIVYPLVLAVGLRDRRPLLISIGVAGALLIYSTAGFRSALLLPAVVVAAYALARSRLGAPAIAWALIAAVSISAVLAVIGSSTMVSLLVRRAMMVPGQLTAFYFDFFSQHPVYELRHGVLSFLGDPPYGPDYPPPVLIADRYLDGGHSNANVWADAMANFGLAGVVIFTLLLVVGLWIADRLTMHHGPLLLIGIGAIAGFTYSNTGLLTGSFSGGVGLLVLLAAMGRAPSESRLGPPPRPWWRRLIRPPGAPAPPAPPG